MKLLRFPKGERHSLCSKNFSMRFQTGLIRCLPNTRVTSPIVVHGLTTSWQLCSLRAPRFSAVRLKSDNKKISLKLPTNEVFIQSCYNNIAKDLYRDPYIFHEEQSEYMRDDQLTQRFCLCIESTVKELIPVQQILQTYMSQDNSRDIDLDGDVHDTEDPDVFDGHEEPPLPEPPFPESESLPENEDMMGTEEQIQPTGLENEFKTVPGVEAPEPQLEPQSELEPHSEPTFGIPPQAIDEDEGVLFGDAPDHRVKKTAYN